MKLAQYHRQYGGGNDKIVFAKGEDDPRLKQGPWDRVYITTLFSFEWKKTEKCLDRALELVDGTKIFVGGIAASLMTEEFKSVERWQDIRFIQGLLDGPPADSLRLTSSDFGYEDTTSKPIEEHTPDYSILDDMDYHYPVHDAYFGYASRGCIRKCSFCGVPKLEGAQRQMPPISQFVRDIDKLYGIKKDLILMDNNVTAAPNFKDIIAEIRDLGFKRGASISRGDRRLKRRVDFNQGVDSRLLSKSPFMLKEMATLCIDPLRIAFDHWGLRKPYETSIREAARHGITSLSNYMLYNFYDTPEDLYRRLALNIALNEELKIRIWSFPMRYQPIDLKDRSFVGRHWNRHFLRSFQIILQATRGVVTGNPDFFNMAFGASVDEFHALLMMPPGFIFNRRHFFQGEGRGQLDDYKIKMSRLSESQKEELVVCLAEAYEKTSGPKRTRLAQYDRQLLDGSLDPGIKDVLRFHQSHHRSNKKIESQPFSKADLFNNADLIVPEDKKVEDAGLYDGKA